MDQYDEPHNHSLSKKKKKDCRVISNRYNTKLKFKNML